MNSNFSILDCTLRDGGYINNWDFKDLNIKYILSKLKKAEVDFIEMGFLSKNAEVKTHSTLYRQFHQLDDLIVSQDGLVEYAAMIMFGSYDLEEIPKRSDTKVGILRIAIHQKDIEEGLVYAEQLIKKGFKVFVQLTKTNFYTHKELLKVISKINNFSPFAVSIVDTFGSMTTNDVIKLFYTFDYNLSKNIKIGYHGYNNLQLAFSTAQSLLNLETNRDIIIDSSIYGMGRGAGNLNTELLLDYINKIYPNRFSIKPILEAIDIVIKPIYNRISWGYSIPYYLTAIFESHPNYGKFLSDKGTLSVNAMNQVISKIPKNKKASYDLEFITELYNQYMSELQGNGDNLEILKQIINHKKCLFVASGPSFTGENNKIINFIKENRPLVVTINFDPLNFDKDYVFVTNLKRFEQLRNLTLENLIVTSNVKTDLNLYEIDYSKLLNDDDRVNDNAGLMAISLLIQLGVETIYLAGFDGHKPSMRNYYKDELSTEQSVEKLNSINEGFVSVLKNYRQKVNIEFITKSLYEESLSENVD